MHTWHAAELQLIRVSECTRRVAVKSRTANPRSFKSHPDVTISRRSSLRSWTGRAASSCGGCPTSRERVQKLLLQATSLNSFRPNYPYTHMFGRHPQNAKTFHRGAQPGNKLNFTFSGPSPPSALPRKQCCRESVSRNSSSRQQT